MYIIEASEVFWKEPLTADLMYTTIAVPLNKETMDRWDPQVEKSLYFPPPDGIFKTEETI